MCWSFVRLVDKAVLGYHCRHLELIAAPICDETLPGESHLAGDERDATVQSQEASEVAEQFGMKKSTVRESKRRMLKRLREQWDVLFGEWPFAFDGSSLA